MAALTDRNQHYYCHRTQSLRTPSNDLGPNVDLILTDLGTLKFGGSTQPAIVRSAIVQVWGQPTFARTSWTKSIRAIWDLRTSDEQIIHTRYKTLYKVRRLTVVTSSPRWWVLVKKKKKKTLVFVPFFATTVSARAKWLYITELCTEKPLRISSW